MCGIVGYIGERKADEILVKGLQRLEYRGYDSAGIAVLNGQMLVTKGKGKVENLVKKLAENAVHGNVGIGHTRWATHGEPNDVNSHPHVSGSGQVAVVHNGIIENYNALKKQLEARGRTFHSQTDTEIIAQLLEQIYEDNGRQDFETAVLMTLKQLVGTYGIAILNKEDPDKVFIARKGSPLLLGVGEGEMFVASDASPIIEYTNRVVYLDDGEFAVVTRDDYTVKNIDDVEMSKEVHELAMNLEEIEKAGYPHFMLKEIFEQPRSIADCMRGRIDPESGTITLGGITRVMEELAKAHRIVIAACGTSWHSGLVGEYLFEELAKTVVEVEYASEFRYRDPLVGEGDILIAISQSGETADTLAALREAKKRGATVVGICNVVGSTIARETHAGVYTHAGPEIGVASTKAFTAQVAVLTMMAIGVGVSKGHITPERAKELIQELDRIPKKVSQILDEIDEPVQKLAYEFTDYPNFLYLGRSYNFPVALEGALKLKEISYIHAEGYPAAEMKHGPIALIDENMPVVVIAATDHTNDKMISNIEEIRARKGQVISIMNKGNEEVAELSDFSIQIPSTEDCLSPLLTAIPLQLLSYYIAVNRGCDVDQPRNLAKSVTVE
jgi:glucosamine--fructose-6-phosphate aminotransferase (isomerizing)